MGEGGNSVRSRQASKRAALVRIEEPSGTGHTGESRVHYHFKDLRKGLEKNLTITRKDEGQSYEGFPGLSRTMPSALLRVRG